MALGGTRSAATVIALLACVLTWIPATAHADVGDYASHAWPGCSGGTNSGGFDGAGHIYVPCGNPATIAVYDEAGHLVRSIATGRRVTDVAPTTDGRYLYLAGDGDLVRMARAGDGSYALDGSWHADRYPLWGTTFAPRGWFVDTDDAGNVYLADGTWSSNLTHTIVKYDEQGRFVTRFGEWANTWNLGTFYWALGGVAASPDGSTVYTVELGNNRIQRWERRAGGDYRAASSFGSMQANNADRAGYCDYDSWRGTLAAPYDVALDGAGNVYVINTTCKQVLSWTADLSALRLSADVRVAGGDYPRPHGFAVGRNGAVYVGENQRVLRPAGGALVGDGLPPAPAVADPSPTAVAPPTVDPAPSVTPRLERPPTTPPSPGVADRTAPRVHMGRARSLANRAVRIPVRCSETCRVEVVARLQGRMVGRRVMWLRAGRQLPVAARITLRARPGRVGLQVRIRDRAGNGVSYRRAGLVRIPRRR